jgi:putative transposase
MADAHDGGLVELVEELGGDRVRGLFRELLGRALQELIDTELSEAIGAEPHERTETRSNRRNGGRSRMLSTPAGDVELRIPKVRVGSFFPSLLEPRRRVDRALWAVIMTAYVTGTSTRKVDDLVRALGVDAGISKSTVSRICAEIDVEVDAFRNRPLDTSGSPTCGWTPPTSKPERITASSPERWWSPPPSPLMATEKSSIWRWVTPRTRCSGPSFSAG